MNENTSKLLQVVYSDQVLTCMQNESPVITMERKPRYYAGSVVNFLRAGCPSVQLILIDPYNDFDKPNEDAASSLTELTGFLKELQIGKETFTVEERDHSYIVTRSIS
jgi:hypothetical protein